MTLYDRDLPQLACRCAFTKRGLPDPFQRRTRNRARTACACAQIWPFCIAFERQLVVRSHTLADNPAVSARSVTAVMGVLLFSIVGGCTSAVNSAHEHGSQSAQRSTSSGRPVAVALGAAGCRPASPPVPGMIGIPRGEGTGHGASLWAPVRFPRPAAPPGGGSGGDRQREAGGW